MAVHVVHVCSPYVLTRLGFSEYSTPSTCKRRANFKNEVEPFKQGS